MYKVNILTNKSEKHFEVNTVLEAEQAIEKVELIDGDFIIDLEILKDGAIVASTNDDGELEFA